MTKGPLLVAIDGPNGVGKTTLVEFVAAKLARHGLSVVVTKEPSCTTLGNLIRSLESQYRGITYACLIAADRYYHLETEIVPALRQGQTVISARYVLSSLALQVLDGVDIDFVWNLNCMAPSADLTILLTAGVDELSARIEARGSLSWFERAIPRDAEVQAYLRAADFLRDKGMRVEVVDTTEGSIEANTDKIVSHILAVQKG